MGVCGRSPEQKHPAVFNQMPRGQNRRGSYPNTQRGYAQRYGTTRDVIYRYIRGGGDPEDEAAVLDFIRRHTRSASHSAPPPSQPRSAPPRPRTHPNGDTALGIFYDSRWLTVEEWHALKEAEFRRFTAMLERIVPPGANLSEQILLHRLARPIFRRAFG